MPDTSRWHNIYYLVLLPLVPVFLLVCIIVVEVIAYSLGNNPRIGRTLFLAYAAVLFLGIAVLLSVFLYGLKNKKLNWPARRQSAPAE